MGATTWSKFFWADWESDERLKLCSPGAQALWMRMLCVCAKAEGYLTIEDQKLAADDMARLTGWPLRDVRRWWAELEKWGVFSMDRKGIVYSRRMVKDAKRVRVGRETGPKGGNPNLRKDNTNSDTLNGRPNGRSGRARIQNPESPQTPQGASSKWIWKGPPAILAAVERRLFEKAEGYLGYFTWREVPERALVTSSPTMFDKLAECEADLHEIGWRLVLEERKSA